MLSNKLKRTRFFVMAGLSRLSASFLLLRCQDVDARDKPGHDEFRLRYRFLGLSR